MISFKEWLKKEEMTSAAAVSGSGSFTNSIARFQRPLGSGEKPKVHKKKKKKD